MNEPELTGLPNKNCAIQKALCRFNRHVKISNEAAITMSNVTIFQFQMLDPDTLDARLSTRWGTRDGINTYTSDQGMVLEQTATEVDEDAVASDLQGLTTRGFIPPAN